VRSVKLHEGEVEIDAQLVARLVAGQFPELADLPIRAVQSTGTVNAIYRIGDALYARLPRLAAWAESLDNELRWLPRLAGGLSLRIPEPVASGRPGGGYPFPWAIYRWLDGEPYADELVSDEPQAARDLARFVLELRQTAPEEGRPAGRRPLRELDAVTREAIESARGAIDAGAVTEAWEEALEARPWNGRRSWIHADLLRPNLLVRHGRIAAVIDFGGAGRGDPATDVIAAWAVFGPAGRRAYREALAVDEDAWARARGIALHQAVLIVPYYAETNPRFAAMARRTIAQILAPDG
jgi:aminoglycoside phosphotransferase (APT) family kinase protein